MIRTKILNVGDTVQTSRGACHVVKDDGQSTITVRDTMTNKVFDEMAVVVYPRYRTPSGSLMFGPPVGAIDEDEQERDAEAADSRYGEGCE